MPNRLTKEIIERVNDQRRRLGRPLLSRAGFEAAIRLQAQDRSEHSLVVNLVNHVVEPADIATHTSAWEVPAAAGFQAGADSTPQASPGSSAGTASPDAGVNGDGS